MAKLQLTICHTNCVTHLSFSDEGGAQKALGDIEKAMANAPAMFENRDEPKLVKIHWKHGETTFLIASISAVTLEDAEALKADQTAERDKNWAHARELDRRLVEDIIAQRT